MKTTKTKHEKEHMNKVAEFGCLICHKLGFPKTPCELHHIKNHTGMSKKAITTRQKHLQKNGEVKKIY